MFYEPKHGHGLPWDPFKAIVAPRPIGWISTLDREGRPNLAPYSYFGIAQGRPPIVSFASEGMKHTVTNARDTGEFVFNLVTTALSDAMNLTSQALPEGRDEFLHAGLASAPCRMVQVPRVAAAPAALECRVTQFVTLLDSTGQPTDGFLVLGEVVGVHIDPHYLKDGRFDTAAASPLARCGYRDYVSVDLVFELLRPDDVAAPAVARPPRRL